MSEAEDSFLHVLDFDTITLGLGKWHQRDTALESFRAAPAELVKTLDFFVLFFFWPFFEK